MSGIAVVIVITLLVVTLVVVVATAVVLVTHLKNLAGVVKTVQTDVEPELARLREAAEVTRAELERVSDAADDLRDRGDGLTPR